VTVASSRPAGADRHDSGCKVKMPLPPGVTGSAIFRGERDEHRLVLERRFADLTISADPEAFALWLGMNPSGAEADVNDLTIVKECTWTKRLGFRRYVKGNAGTYRWTDSTTLNASRCVLSHPDNLPVLRALAAEAGIIVLATGKPPERLLPDVAALFDALKSDGRTVHCLGTTKDGWPKHSSRLGYGTPFVEYQL